MAEHSDGLHEIEIILATEALLQTERCVEQILKMVAKRCSFDGGAWHYQKPFFFNLFANFFKETNDNPAWVTICPQRITFKSRQGQRIQVDQSPGLMYPQFRGDKVGKESSTLKLGWLNFSLKDISMSQKEDVDIVETEIVKQTITRELRDLETNMVRFVDEQWAYLATPGDPKDIKTASEGGVPALSQHFKKKESIQEAALLSLCRKAPKLPWMEALSLNLMPKDGRVLDFRFMQYPMDYYLISNINNLAVITQSATDGGWQHL